LTLAALASLSLLVLVGLGVSFILIAVGFGVAGAAFGSWTAGLAVLVVAVAGLGVL